MTTISNASPLIALSAISSFDLLTSLFGTIHIPEAVYEEVVVVGAGRPGAQEVAATAGITRHTVTDQPAVLQIMSTTGLQRGESEAIALALELGATRILLDDQRARRYAQDQGLATTGTGGVLLLAKDQQLIPSVKQPLDALIAAGMRIHPLLYQELLRKAGE